MKYIVVAQGKLVTTSKSTEMMQSFSTVPAWVKLEKRSACRLGVMRGLELSKSYHPDMNPELLVDGFPELKADGSKFSKADYINIVKETRIFATKIADGIDLSNFEPGYDERNKRRKINPPEPVPFSELPPPKEKSADPASSTEPTSGEEEDDLKIEDFSDVFCEDHDYLTDPAGSAGVQQ